MTEEFNILERQKERLLDAIRRTACINFVNGICELIHEENGDVKKSMVDEFCKYSTIGLKNGRILVTFRCSKDENKESKKDMEHDPKK